MHPRAKSVEASPPYQLLVLFDDGTRGVVDCSDLIHARNDGVFAPLRDPALFDQVRVNPEFGVVEWPTGADIDPETLYERARG